MEIKEYSKKLNSAIENTVEELNIELKEIQELTKEFLTKNGELGGMRSVKIAFWNHHMDALNCNLARLNRYLEEVEEIANI